MTFVRYFHRCQISAVEKRKKGRYILTLVRCLHILFQRSAVGAKMKQWKKEIYLDACSLSSQILRHLLLGKKMKQWKKEKISRRLFAVFTDARYLLWKYETTKERYLHACLLFSQMLRYLLLGKMKQWKKGKISYSPCSLFSQMPDNYISCGKKRNNKRMESYLQACPLF